MTATLDRTLGLGQATAMVVGIIIGASIFVQPSEITRLVPSSSGVLIAWLTAGALTLAGALVCAIAFAGANRIVAGSDYPHQIGSIQKMLEAIDDLPVSSEDRAAILGGTMARLIGRAGG